MITGGPDRRALASRQRDGARDPLEVRGLLGALSLSLLAIYICMYYTCIYIHIHIYIYIYIYIYIWILTIIIIIVIIIAIVIVIIIRLLGGHVLLLCVRSTLAVRIIVYNLIPFFMIYIYIYTHIHYHFLFRAFLLVLVTHLKFVDSSAGHEVYTAIFHTNNCQTKNL